MDFNDDFEQQCRDKMTVMFLSEIMNRLGVVEAGKIFRNVSENVENVDDDDIRLKLKTFISNVREGYMKS
ncbi:MULTISPECIES: hypothetical protein [unclassified Raoultella]|uniref:hypothetical protein n=1 Tax=unclassified Raoultella TaxID=2627600 RepID=UPI001357C40A|nr:MULTISPECIES: hypothetical protein [unclassified Raoultella]